MKRVWIGMALLVFLGFASGGARAANLETVSTYTHDFPNDVGEFDWYDPDAGTYVQAADGDSVTVKAAHNGVTIKVDDSTDDTVSMGSLTVNGNCVLAVGDTESSDLTFTLGGLSVSANKTLTLTTDNSDDNTLTLADGGDFTLGDGVVNVFLQTGQDLTLDLNGGTFRLENIVVASGAYFKIQGPGTVYVDGNAEVEGSIYVYNEGVNDDVEDSDDLLTVYVTNAGILDVHYLAVGWVNEDADAIFRGAGRVQFNTTRSSSDEGDVRLVGGDPSLHVRIKTGYDFLVDTVEVTDIGSGKEKGVIVGGAAGAWDGRLAIRDEIDLESGGTVQIQKLLVSGADGLTTPDDGEFVVTHLVMDDGATLALEKDLTVSTLAVQGSATFRSVASEENRLTVDDVATFAQSSGASFVNFETPTLLNGDVTATLTVANATWRLRDLLALGDEEEDLFSIHAVGGNLGMALTEETAGAQLTVFGDVELSSAEGKRLTLDVSQAQRGDTPTLPGDLTIKGGLFELAAEGPLRVQGNTTFEAIGAMTLEFASPLQMLEDLTVQLGESGGFDMDLYMDPDSLPVVYGDLILQGGDGTLEMLNASIDLQGDLAVTGGNTITLDTMEDFTVLGGLDVAPETTLVYNGSHRTGTVLTVSDLATIRGKVQIGGDDIVSFAGGTVPARRALPESGDSDTTFSIPEAASGAFEGITGTPGVSLEAPDENGLSGNQTVHLAWTDWDMDSNAAIDLYYGASATTSTLTALASGIAEDNTTDAYDWDVSQVPAGTYYIYATISDGDYAGTSWAPGLVTVTPHAPVLSMDAPADLVDLEDVGGGAPADLQGVLVSDLFTIPFTVIDPDSTGASLSLYYMTAWDAAEGTLIDTVSRAENETGYDWDVSALPEGDYFLYGEAFDSTGTDRVQPGYVVRVSDDAPSTGDDDDDDGDAGGTGDDDDDDGSSDPTLGSGGTNPDIPTLGAFGIDIRPDSGAVYVQPGDRLRALVAFTEANRYVDIYVVLVDPYGSLHSVRPGGYFAPPALLEPMVRGWVSESVRDVPVFDATIPDGLLAGRYTWYVVAVLSGRSANNPNHWLAWQTWTFEVRP